MDFNNNVLIEDAVFVQEIDGEIMLLDMNTENYFGLDPIASDIWRLLREGKSIQDTYSVLLDVYDVDPETLKKDIETFVSSLIDNKLATLA